MKKFKLIFAYSLFPLLSYAQFSTPDGNNEIHYTGGNVGIGISNPYELLHVGSGTDATIRLGSNPQLLLKKYTDKFTIQVVGSSYASYPLQLGRNDGNNIVYTLGNFGIGTSDPDYELTVNGTMHSNEALVAGKLGIGTTVPDHELTVNGTIHCKEVLVDTNIPIADYVFEDDYKLSTLEETEKYIDVNHHLPGIPSAAEFKKTGVNVIELDMLLLEKIEELTLHMIEMNKRVNQLLEENTALKSQLDK